MRSSWVTSAMNSSLRRSSSRSRSFWAKRSAARPPRMPALPARPRRDARGRLRPACAWVTSCPIAETPTTFSPKHGWGENGERDVEQASIRRLAHRLEQGDVIAGDHLAEEAHRVLLLPLGNDGRDLLADHLVGRAAEHALGAGVPARQAQIERSARDRVARGLDDRGEAGAGLLASLRSVMSTRNLDPEGCPALVLHEDRLVQHPDGSDRRLRVAIPSGGLPVRGGVRRPRGPRRGRPGARHRSGGSASGSTRRP